MSVCGVVVGVDGCCVGEVVAEYSIAWCAGVGAELTVAVGE